MSTTSSAPRAETAVRTGDRWDFPLAVLAVAMLTVGAVVVPWAGWLFGLLLLWVTPLWSVREKLLGSFVLPGGPVAAAILVGNVSLCTTFETTTSARGVTEGSGACGFPLGSTAQDVAMAVVFVLPFLVGALLLHRARRRSADVS